MPKNLAHLNGNLLCAVDIETTGLDFELHDIYELAIIPLNDKLERDVNRPWLDMKIQPTRLHNVVFGEKYTTRRFGKERILDAEKTGLDSQTAQDILNMWFAQQNLNRCKIAPVGSNYAFDSRFLRMWLGNLDYESKFADYETRDTMQIAKFLNDMADFRGEKSFPFAKTSLSYLANLLNVDRDYGKAHTALSDAAITIDVYRKLMQHLNLKMLS